MKRLALIFFLLSLALTPSTGFAYSSKICATGGDEKCSDKEVGVFMKDISIACGNTGDCTLEDIVIVFVNIGNFVVGIIGAVVLLMYVAGGFCWLASAGNKEWVSRGEKLIKVSTAGLLIVMFSHLSIYALRGAIQYGTVAVNEEYVTCVGAETLGDPCGLNSTCTNGGYTCESKCVQSNSTPFKDASAGYETYQNIGKTCVDIKDKKWSKGLSKISGCQKNLCPGDANTQCCEVSDWR